MRIYWLNPPWSTKTIYPDLGWMNMNTSCKNYEWITPIIDWSQYKTVESVIAHILENDPQVLCVSCYVWNHVLISKVCEIVKNKNPNIIIIRGGPQLGYDKDFFEENPWVDYVCHSTGHGEMMLKEALSQILHNDKIIEPEKVPYLIMKDWMFTPQKIKFEYEESVIEHNMLYIIDSFAAAKNKGVRWGVQYETTRGCPYSCSYCEWGAGGTGTKISQKPIEMIERELEILSVLGVIDLEIIDANFGILPRDSEIAKYIASLKQKYTYPRNVMLYGLAKVKAEKKEKVLDVFIDSGLMTSYFMPIQSASNIALKNVKRTDIEIEDNIRLARKYREKYGIPIKVELILGLPGSTTKDFYYEMDLIQQTGGWDWPRAPFSILPDTDAAQRFFQAMYKLQISRVGVSENEEQHLTYMSKDSIVGTVRSYHDIVTSTYSYTHEEWKEMFFMNKAQKVIGPMIPNTIKASEIMPNLFKQISQKEWYKLFDNDMNTIINSDKINEDYMIIDGRTVEENLKDYENEIRLMVNSYTCS